jgi:hypothetical protein
LKTIRRLIALSAWIPAVIAVGLIAVYVRVNYPGAVSSLEKLLYRHGEEAGEVVYISRFSNERDLERWRSEGVELTGGGGAARVVFTTGTTFPGIRLTDYTFGPARIRNWSDYRWLKWEMVALEDTEESLSLIVKDAGERRFKRTYALSRGEAFECIAVNLAEMTPMIDLTRVAELHFYVEKPEKKVLITIKDLRLERGGAQPGEVMGKPFVVFEKVIMPERASLGQRIDVSAILSITQPQTIPFAVFVHLFLESEKAIEKPSHRMGYIHLEKKPFVPVPEWDVNTPMQVGPFPIYLPTFNPEGRYLVQIGLFNSLSPGNGPRNVPYKGAYDYSGSYPKCRYENPDIEDFVVGSLDVLAEPR